MERDMRDMDKIRESYEFNMQGSQVKLLILGAAVICLLVFVLGVLVGRRFPPQPAPREFASRETLPQDPSGNKASSPGFSFEFYEELADKKSDEVPPQPNAVPPKASETVPAPDTDLPVTVVDRAEVAALPVKPETTNTPVPQTFTSMYTIQVSAFEDPSGAEKLAGRLKLKGFASYTQVKTIPRKGTWYRVRVGRYATRGDAEKTAKVLEEREGFSPFITLYAENER